MKTMGYETDKVDPPENVAGNLRFDKGVVDTTKETDASLLRPLHDKGLATTAAGAGTAVNWSACLRTPPTLLEERGVSQKLPLFTSPAYAAAVDADHRRLGVTYKCAEEGFQNQVLLKGCNNLGLDVEFIPRNSSEEHYCGSCCYGCRAGEKQGTDRTWLVDAVKHGAVILTSCKASRFIPDKNQSSDNKMKKKMCVGVVATSLGSGIRKELHVRARITISACGSSLTPPLIVASGLKNLNMGGTFTSTVS